MLEENIMLMYNKIEMPPPPYPMWIDWYYGCLFNLLCLGLSIFQSDCQNACIGWLGILILYQFEGVNWSSVLH